MRVYNHYRSVALGNGYSDKQAEIIANKGMLMAENLITCDKYIPQVRGNLAIIDRWVMGDKPCRRWQLITLDNKQENLGCFVSLKAAKKAMLSLLED